MSVVTYQVMMVFLKGSYKYDYRGIKTNGAHKHGPSEYYHYV